MSTKPNARIVLDSISPTGQRLTTMEVTMHRFVLAEFNTHRAFSRNSASSRAIPIEKHIQSVLNDPAMPLEWGSAKPGMQAGEELTEEYKRAAIIEWEIARDNAVGTTKRLDLFGLHKQVVNRLLEPFLWHTALVSSTEWDNFFEQRATPICDACDGSLTFKRPDTGDFEWDCNKCLGKPLKSLAQPEIVVVADAMRDALNVSEPVQRKWHMPYVCDDPAIASDIFSFKEMQMISVARCARVSYAHFDTNTANTAKDLLLADKLFSATPPHMSPFEHVAQADDTNVNSDNMGYGSTYQRGNFTGWKQLRHMVFGK